MLIGSVCEERKTDYRRTSSHLTRIVAVVMVLSTAGCVNAVYAVEPLNHGVDPDAGSSQTPLAPRELQILGTHISPTISAEFTSNGKWIVVSGTDGVTIHDAVSTKCVNWLNGELAEVSPDGGSFLLSHPSGPYELRSIPGGKLLWRLPSDVLPKNTWRPRIHFSDDGQYIACGYQSLLRIKTKEVVFRAPKSYSYNTINGKDVYRNPDDRPPIDDEALPASLGNLPYLYRATLRHDGRPLITLKSGLCSPSGRFMIVQTAEEDSSFDAFYSYINRKTGERLFSDVRSSKAVFFHDDDYVLHDGSVYGTKDKEICYTLALGITSVALSLDETLLAVGWRTGEIAVIDPTSGKERFRTTVEEHVDTKHQQSGNVVSLAFSGDSKRLAAVGRKLTLIDIPSQTVVDVFDLGPGSRRGSDPERTSSGKVTFNAEGSRLLLTGRQVSTYLNSRPKAHVFCTEDLKQRRYLCSLGWFDDVQRNLPVYFSSDAAWAIVPKEGPSAGYDELHLWDTEANQPICRVFPQQLRWHYRRRFVVPDFPKRHLGLGRFYRWYADEPVLFPWSIESIESRSKKSLPKGATEWLESFVRTNPHNTHRSVNGTTLDHLPKQWRLSIRSNRVQALYDLSTGKIYPPNRKEPTHEDLAELDAIDVPDTCWGLSYVEGNAFSPDGSRLLTYCKWRRTETRDLLALFEMPSGKLIRNFEGHSHIERIHIAPNNRIAAISRAFYTKTWIIDLETGKTLVELPGGGKCVFSPDSRYAQVGDRYGESRSLLRIDTGEFIDFEWADRWSFSPNSRYVVGVAYRGSWFLDLTSGEKTPMPGEIHQTGMRTLSTTKLVFPYRGSRFLCADKGKIRLFNVNTAQSIATFDPPKIARECAVNCERVAKSYGGTSPSRYLYTPDDQSFVNVIEGVGITGGTSDSENRSALPSEPQEYSTQVLAGDLETGKRVECSVPSWCKTPIQHRLFTPDGARLITISSDKMVCWRLHPPEIAWEANLSGRWTDPETGSPFPEEETLRWSLGYSIYPNDKWILIAADGREAIMFNLATGQEQQRFGPLPINSVLRFGANGAHLQVNFRANQSMRLYDVYSGKLIKTYHFTNEGTRLHRIDAIGKRKK